MNDSRLDAFAIVVIEGITKLFNAKGMMKYREEYTSRIKQILGDDPKVKTEVQEVADPVVTVDPKIDRKLEKAKVRYENKLRALNQPQLRALAKKEGVKTDNKMTKDALINQLMKKNEG